MRQLLEAREEERFETFVVELDEAKISDGCTLCADFFSFIADDAVCGVFRKDIVELLKSMKPGFMRFPGGCIVEGNELSNRYQWKHTVGRREDRVRTGTAGLFMAMRRSLFLRAHSATTTRAMI